MTRALVVSGLCCAVAAVVAGTATSAPSDRAAARVFDRTFSCEAGYVGGLHRVELSSAFSPAPGTSRLRPSSAVSRNMHDAALGSLGWDGVSVHRGFCTPSRAQLGLTTKGLRGGGVPALGAEATCETGRRVLLRVRAVFARPATTETRRTFGFPQLTAAGDLRHAALAVGTATGTTVAYLSVTHTGKARLFTRRHCKED